MNRIKYFIMGVVVIILLMSTIGSQVSSMTYNNKAEKYVKIACSMGPILEVTTDKLVYRVGEPVAIFLTNVGDEMLSGGGPTVTIFDEQDHIVYQEATYCWHELEPGESIEWLPWDQTNKQGQQVPIGKYVVEGFLSGFYGNYVDNVTFFIINYDPSDPPYGPNEGVVGEEYIFCFEIPGNSECEPYHVIWRWGDNTNSEWSGPYAAGETVCANHTWYEPGDYEVMVGIKDGFGSEYWSEPLIIAIYTDASTELEIEISDYFENTNPIIRYYHGIQIKNIGYEIAGNIAVDFWVSGGIFSRLRERLKMTDYWAYGCGKIEPDEKTYCPISLNLLYLGNIEMTAEVWANNAEPVSKTVNAFASVGFIWVNPQE